VQCKFDAIDFFYRQLIGKIGLSNPFLKKIKLYIPHLGFILTSAIGRKIMEYKSPSTFPHTSSCNKNTKLFFIKQVVCI